MRAESALTWRSAIWPSWIVVGAVAVGLVITRFPTSTVILAVTLAGVLSWVIVGGAVRALAALAAVTALGGLATLTTVGQVDIRALDVVYALALGLALLLPGPWSSARLPLWPVVLVLGYVGLSLLIVAQRTSELVESSFISWVRLVQTFLLAWITCHVVRSPNDMRRVLSGFLAGGIGAIMLALFLAPWDAIATTRTGGLHNANSLGLISVLMIVVALFSSVPRRPVGRIALVLLGALGLGLSRSVASLIAAVVVLGLGATASRHSPWPRRIRGILVLAVLTLFALSFIRVARPDLGSDLARTSVGHRLILGAAGWEVFARNPLLGVGWQASPAYLGEHTIAGAVRERFSSVPFVPGEEGGTSVHNAYIHVLAELGLVGALLAGFAGLTYWRAFRRLPSEPFKTTTGLAMVAILIWWNDNPIYGGQVETVILAILLGLGSAIVAWHLAREPAPPEPGVTPGVRAPL